MPNPMMEPATTGASSEVWRNSSRARIDEMWHRNRIDRIAQRHGGMGIAAGVEHHPVARLLGALERIDEFPLDVGLEVDEFDVGIAFRKASHEVVERLRAVDRAVAPPLQIEVGTVENQNLHRWTEAAVPLRGGTIFRAKIQHYSIIFDTFA